MRMNLPRRIGRRLRILFRREKVESELSEEIRLHLDMETDELVRQGRTRDAARREARILLGGVEQTKESVRDIHPLRWLGTFSLDVTLGLRMLRKSWGLTLVGGLAMTVAIGIGTLIFDFLDTATGRTLPLDDGDRVVAIQTWDQEAGARRRTSLGDFERWRDDLQSVEEVGAFRTVERNLVIADGPVEPESAAGVPAAVSIAEMTASGFRLARVAPLLGRPLVEEDERESATPVLVIGYDVWQSRFSADPAVVGQPVRLGSTVHIVIGVMPEGFAFPVNHSLWAPLRADPLDHLPPGPEGAVFARLAPGATLDGAQAELTTVGLLPPSAPPETDEQLRPRIVPYTVAFTSDSDIWILRLIQLLVTLLLVPPCANIAILVYARTVTRQEEFAARFVLGASRGRIVGQLFVEMFMLAAVAGGAALVLARVAVRQVQGDMVQRGATIPFWVDFNLSYKTVLFVAGLVIIAAMLASVVPALLVTGRLRQSGLHALGGANRMKLGATWIALVAVAVALSFALLPGAVEMAWGTARSGILGPGFAAEEFLTARLTMDGETPPGAQAKSDSSQFASRFGALQAELIRQLEAEPSVSAATVSAAVPGEEPWLLIEIDKVSTQDDDIFESVNFVSVNRVDDDFFDVFDVRFLGGRRFEAGGFESERAAVIVNQTFVRKIVGDENPLGRRVRYIDMRDSAAPAASEHWYEIVGVVEDLHASAARPTMYHPAAPGQMHPVSLALHVEATSASVAVRLREMTTALHPNLRVDEIRFLDAIYRNQAVGNYLGASALVGATLSILLLSAAGMYALMSFTVNQRRREIGIRSALGAQPRRLLAGIFGRVLVQVGAGAAGGVLVALLVQHYIPIEEMGGWSIPGILPAAAAFMIVVGLLAVVGPARRALRVDPSDALREG